MCNICDCGLHMKVSTSVLSWDFLYCVVKKRSEHILIVSSSWMHQLAELSSPHYQCLLPINMSELFHTQFTRLSLPDSLKFLNAVEKLAEVISPHYHCLSVLEMSKLFHTQFTRLSLLDSQVNPVSNGYQKKISWGSKGGQCNTDLITKCWFVYTKYGCKPCMPNLINGVKRFLLFTR